jgi:virulence-associated protein VapD
MHRPHRRTGDTVDNVEQVEITNTVAGTYTVLITQEQTDWIDPNGSTNTVRFYKIKKVE